MSFLAAENVKYIVVHCSDSPNNPNDGRLDTAADIHRWHLERGWSGIGYHWVITEQGDIQAGRPQYWAGAGVRGHNSESIHVCMVGNGLYHGPQWIALAKKVRELTAAYPWAEVVGHNDLDSSKECPRFDVPAWWETQK